MRYLFFVCSLLLLSIVHGADAEGSYQRTKDGKSRVWNNHPLPGDAATWSGPRDAEGYATGHGTLTWYRTEKKFVTGSNLAMSKHIEASRYTGEMIHGKLDGPVKNVDANGKVFHGTFADGKKTGRWSPGPAPKSERSEERVARAQLVEPPPPAAGPPPPRAIPQPPKQNAAEQPVTQSPATSDHSAQTPKKEPAEYDDSLRSLVGPPSTVPPPPVTSPSPSAPPVRSTSSPPPPAGPRLTTSEVTALADAEASAKGYKTGDYQRPQAHYTAENDRWSVTYDQAALDSNGMARVGKHFNVTVEDKTKKISIEK